MNNFSCIRCTTTKKTNPSKKSRGRDQADAKNKIKEALGSMVAMQLAHSKFGKVKLAFHDHVLKLMFMNVTPSYPSEESTSLVDNDDPSLSAFNAVTCIICGKFTLWYFCLKYHYAF